MKVLEETIDARVPDGPIDQKWTRHRNELKLVSPNNKRKYTVIVVGTGLAGGSAAATLAELGYNVLAFCYQDSARRAHSIAAPDVPASHASSPSDGCHDHEPAGTVSVSVRVWLNPVSCTTSANR